MCPCSVRPLIPGHPDVAPHSETADSPGLPLWHLVMAPSRPAAVGCWHLVLAPVLAGALGAIVFVALRYWRPLGRLLGGVPQCT